MKKKTSSLLLVILLLFICGCGAETKVLVENTDFVDVSHTLGAPQEILDTYTVGDVLVIPFFRPPHGNVRSHKVEMIVVSSRTPVPGVLDEVRVMVNGELTAFGDDLAGTLLSSTDFQEFEPGRWIGYVTGGALSELTEMLEQVRFQRPRGGAIIDGGMFEPAEGAELPNISIEVDVTVHERETGVVFQRTLAADYLLRKIRYSLIPRA